MAKGTRRRGYKPRDYGSIKAMATALIVAAGGVDRAAAQVRVGKSQLQRYMDPDEPLAQMPLDIAEALTRHTDSPVVAEFFAELVGAMVMPRPVAPGAAATAAERLQEAARIGRALADYLAELLAVQGEASVDGVAAQRLLRAADAAIRAAAECRARIAGMLAS